MLLKSKYIYVINVYTDETTNTSVDSNGHFNLYQAKVLKCVSH